MRSEPWHLQNNMEERSASVAQITLAYSAVPSDEEDRFVQRISRTYREQDDLPSVRVLIHTLSENFNRHIEQEERRRDDDRRLLEVIDRRIRDAEKVIAEDATRAKFAREIGNAVIKLVTLIAVLIGAGIAYIKYKAGLP